MKLLSLQKTTGFDYESFGLEHIKEEADFAAISCCRTIANLEHSVRTLILDDAPRIRKIQEAMRGKKHKESERTCWSVWIDEIFPLSQSTLYNALLISSTLEEASEQVSEMALDRLLQWSQRSLLALSATGDNREAAIKELVEIDPENITEKVVRNKFKPIEEDEKEELLKQVDRYALEEELGVEDPKILRLRVESRASELAENQNKKKPSVGDFQRAIAQVIGKEPQPLLKSRTRVTAKAYQELMEIVKEKDATIESLKSELAEALDRILQLEKMLQNQKGVAA